MTDDKQEMEPPLMALNFIKHLSLDQVGSSESIHQDHPQPRRRPVPLSTISVPRTSNVEFHSHVGAFRSGSLSPRNSLTPN